MTVRETADILHFEILTGGGALDRPIQSVYSCDLLSFVMGRAPADSAWATVMGNVNAMAVAVLAEVVVLAEGAALDDDARAKAEQNDIAVLRSSDPVFETCLAIYTLLNR